MLFSKLAIAVVIARAAAFVPAGIYAIHSSGTNFAALNETTTPGTSVKILSGRPAKGQYWNFQQIDPSQPGGWTIKNTFTGLYLTANAEASTTIEERNFTNDAQLWYFILNGTNPRNFHILNNGVSGVVDAAQSSGENWIAGDLILYPQEYPATFNQVWGFRKPASHMNAE